VKLLNLTKVEIPLNSILDGASVKDLAELLHFALVVALGDSKELEAHLLGPGPALGAPILEARTIIAPMRSINEIKALRPKLRAIFLQVPVAMRHRIPSATATHLACHRTPGSRASAAVTARRNDGALNTDRLWSLDADRVHKKL